MNPFEVLGVATDATPAQIKSAYRGLSKTLHPDNTETGNVEKFEQLNTAYSVLTDPKRRERYKVTGRTDESAATAERIQIFIEDTMRQAVEAEGPNGRTDDPVMDNVLDRILLSMSGAKKGIKDRMAKAQRKVERAQRMIERFKLRTQSSVVDLVGASLLAQKRKWESEYKTQQDALELAEEAEAVFKLYVYEVGPGPEGHVGPGPTIHRGGLRLQSHDSVFKDIFGQG